MSDELSEAQDPWKPKAWFSEDIYYEGIARAMFTTPAGWVSGPAPVRRGSNGKLLIEVTVQEMEVEELSGWPAKFKFNYLATGENRESAMER